MKLMTNLMVIQLVLFLFGEANAFECESQLYFKNDNNDSYTGLYTLDTDTGKYTMYKTSHVIRVNHLNVEKRFEVETFSITNTADPENSSTITSTLRCTYDTAATVPAATCSSALSQCNASWEVETTVGRTTTWEPASNMRLISFREFLQTSIFNIGDEVVLNQHQSLFPGTIPMLISVPHGGDSSDSNIPRTSQRKGWEFSDSHTDDDSADPLQEKDITSENNTINVAHEVQNKYRHHSLTNDFPWVLINRLGRFHLDLNRDYSISDNKEKNRGFKKDNVVKVCKSGSHTGKTVKLLNVEDSVSASGEPTRVWTAVDRTDGIDGEIVQGLKEHQSLYNPDIETCEMHPYAKSMWNAWHKFLANFPTYSEKQLFSHDYPARFLSFHLHGCASCGIDIGYGTKHIFSDSTAITDPKCNTSTCGDDGDEVCDCVGSVPYLYHTTSGSQASEAYFGGLSFDQILTHAHTQISLGSEGHITPPTANSDDKYFSASTGANTLYTVPAGSKPTNFDRIQIEADNNYRTTTNYPNYANMLAIAMKTHVFQNYVAARRDIHPSTCPDIVGFQTFDNKRCTKSFNRTYENVETGFYECEAVAKKSNAVRFQYNLQDHECSIGININSPCNRQNPSPTAVKDSDNDCFYRSCWVRQTSSFHPTEFCRDRFTIKSFQNLTAEQCIKTVEEDADCVGNTLKSYVRRRYLPNGKSYIERMCQCNRIHVTCNNSQTGRFIYSKTC